MSPRCGSSTSGIYELWSIRDQRFINLKPLNRKAQNSWFGGFGLGLGVFWGSGLGVWGGGFCGLRFRFRLVSFGSFCPGFRTGCSEGSARVYGF